MRVGIGGRLRQVACASGLALAAAGCAELGIDAGTVGDVLAAGTGGSGLSRGEVVSGLREALRVGTGRAVARTSATGGFLEDPLLRIALPEELSDAARAARAVGLGSHVDALEVAMNRAAEQASGEATEVFWEAVGRMTIRDAYGILEGGDDAATRYFRHTTEDSLRARFEPIVTTAMGRVGVYRAWDGLAARLPALGLLGDPKASLNEHVTDRTLDGLFAVLAEEEARIREDPAARTTELLRRVFGGGGARAPRHFPSSFSTNEPAASPAAPPSSSSTARFTSRPARDAAT